MKCPLCNVEMRIIKGGYVTNNGKLFSRQIYSCRNENCSNFGKTVKVVYNPLEVTEDNNAEVDSAE